MEESLRPVGQRSFPGQATGSLQPALPAYLLTSQWERGISDPAEMESSHSVPLCWECQASLVSSEGLLEGMSLPGLFSIAGLKVKKLWAWVPFLCWVGVLEKPWDCVVPTVLGSQTTLHVSHFSFGFHLHHFLCLLYLAEQAGEKADLHHLVLFGSDLHF